MIRISQIIITSRFGETIEELKALAENNEHFVSIVREDKFVMEDASLVIEKAYMASSERTIIIMAANRFPSLTQNKLLKIIEEPPPNKEFILLTPSKAAVLPTIKSRLPVVVLDEASETVKLDLDLDNGRLVQEVVFFAERSDITEEVVRLKSHLSQFYEYLNKGGPVGRKLDFLIQEMNREVNTIGSKAGDTFISKHIVEMKGEIERLREQVQIVE
jgi:hypothetical protein